MWYLALQSVFNAFQILFFTSVWNFFCLPLTGRGDKLERVQDGEHGGKCWVGVWVGFCSGSRPWFKCSTWFPSLLCFPLWQKSLFRWVFWWWSLYCSDLTMWFWANSRLERSCNISSWSLSSKSSLLLTVEKATDVSACLGRVSLAGECQESCLFCTGGSNYRCMLSSLSILPLRKCCVLIIVYGLRSCVNRKKKCPKEVQKRS